MGQETEYALSGRDAAGKRLDPSKLVEPLMVAARRSLPHLPCGEGRGVFIGAGGRLYVDTGAHPELTTPECPNPWDVARYIKAGERIMLNLATEMTGAQPLLYEVALFRGNVDYSGTRSTWGCHESYLHRCSDMDLMCRELVPHLVSRLIFTGAGGLDPLAPGLTFLVSPRVVYLDNETSCDTTHDRGIFNTRQEHHAAGGYRRLHLVCGESLFSETAMFLKAGTTMLVVAMIENGLRPGRKVQLRDSVGAMRQFAHDSTCRVKAALADGRMASAVAIQRHYLDFAERHVHESWMPPWAAEVCRHWRAILDRLATGAPASVATTLDWAMKYTLFSGRLARRGQSFESVGRWTKILEQLAERLAQGNETPVLSTAHNLFDPDSGAQRYVEELTPAIRHSGLSWDDLADVLAVRQELCEVDMRCGQLGPSGVLTALDEAGVLTHHFPGVDNYEHAMANPPATGRARVRGQCIQRLAGRNGRLHCYWSHIQDSKNKQQLDLSDPFASEEKWVAQPVPSLSDEMPPFASFMEQAKAYFDRGNYRNAIRCVRAVDMGMCLDDLPPQERREFFRLKAWLESRLGGTTGAATLAEWRVDPGSDFQLVNDFVSIYRFQGLAAAPQVWDWIERGNTLIAQGAPHPLSTRVSFWSHQAYALKCARRLGEAADLLERARVREYHAVAEPRIFSRLLAELADIRRIQGNCAAATDLLAEATTIQTEHHYHGDLADFTFTCRARLAKQEAAALEWLQKACATQRQLGNPMGEARTLVLLARFARESAAAANLKRQIEQIRDDLTALQQCKLLGSILARWSEWTGPDKQPDSHGDFFWGV
jgi:hypothetical protein